MTLDEMDRLAAEKIMGWKLRTEYQMTIPPRSIGNGWLGIEDQKFKYSDSEWQPTRNIAQAFELLDKFPAFQLFTRYPAVKPRCECVVYTAEDPNTARVESISVVEGNTAAEAITKACLKAVGESVD